MKAAVALVIALIIHSIAGLANALRTERSPTKVCTGKIPWGEGLRPQARFEANRRVSGGSWAEME